MKKVIVKSEEIKTDRRCENCGLLNTYVKTRTMERVCRGCGKISKIKVEEIKK